MVILSWCYGSLNPVIKTTFVLLLANFEITPCAQTRLSILNLYISGSKPRLLTATAWTSFSSVFEIE
jgi:hypothetical protein